MHVNATLMTCAQFVIVSSFDHVDPGLPVEERVALAMKRCGVSITCEPYGWISRFPVASTLLPWPKLMGRCSFASSFPPRVSYPHASVIL